MSKKIDILNCAYEIAEQYGLIYVTRDSVAERAAVGQGTVNYHWDTIDHLRNAVVEKAIKLGNIKVVSEGIVLRNKAALQSELSVFTTQFSSLLVEFSKLREAGQNLINFVKSKYPGEELYCPYMKALDEACKSADQSKKEDV